MRLSRSRECFLAAALVGLTFVWGGAGAAWDDVAVADDEDWRALPGSQTTNHLVYRLAAAPNATALYPPPPPGRRLQPREIKFPITITERLGEQQGGYGWIHYSAPRAAVCLLEAYPYLKKNNLPGGE